MAINFQKLLQCLSINEPLQVYMGAWSTLDTECGTVGCLYGNYRMLQMKLEINFEKQNFKCVGFPQIFSKPNLAYDEQIAQVEAEFGITQYEANWLFGFQVKATNSGKYKDGRYCRVMYDRPLVRKYEAMARLRKFLYYKLHKQEMVVESGRNKQLTHLGRNISGTESVKEAQDHYDNNDIVQTIIDKRHAVLANIS